MRREELYKKCRIKSLLIYSTDFSHTQNTHLLHISAVSQHDDRRSQSSIKYVRLSMCQEKCCEQIIISFFFSGLF
jgi:hypothetical protein